MNIVIIEQNKIFRESLKTALDQIPGFTVVFDADNDSAFDGIGNIHVNLILLDFGFGNDKCKETILKGSSLWPTVKFLLLVNYKEDCNLNRSRIPDVLLKSSTKKEFENKIRKQQSMEINNLIK